MPAAVEHPKGLLPARLVLVVLILLSAGAAHARPVTDFLALDGGVDMQAIRASGYEGAVELMGSEGRIDTGGRVTFPVRAAGAPSPDNEHWAPLSRKLQGLDGSVYALAVYDGLLIVGGRFIHAGGVQVNNIAAWDGYCWYDLNFGFKGYGAYEDAFCSALAVYQGDLYAGGTFRRAGGVVANNIARWDGSQWHPLAGGVSSGVYALTIFGGNLVAGGGFSSVDGMTASGVAAWDGTFHQWQPMGSNGNYAFLVFALAVYNTRLYAGGWFETTPPSSSESPAFNVARWNGSRWVALRQSNCSSQTGFGVASHNGISDSRVQALCVYGGSLYIGGQFGYAGSDPGLQGSCVDQIGASHITRWSDSANNFLAVGGGVRYASLYLRAEVRALSVVNGSLVVGGEFHQAGSVSVSEIAAWNGASWSAFTPGADQRVNAILPDYGGQMIAGGDFNLIGGRTATAIAGYDSNTGQWSPLYETGVDDVVSAVSPIYFQPLNSFGIALGGFQSKACAQPVTGISVWDGNVFKPMAGGLGGSPGGAGGSGHALATLDTTLFVGGSFASAGGAPANNIASWSPSSGWSALGAGLDGSVSALTVFNGSVVAGGDFLGSAGIPLGRIARWDTPSGTWQPFGATPGGAGFDGTVLTLVPYQGSLLAAGRFTDVGGLPAAGVAWWTGEGWMPLGSGVQTATGLPGEVHAIAVEASDACPSGCAIVVGGQFDLAGGAPAANLARWDGTSWAALDGGADGPVDALAWYHGALVAGGHFASVGGVPAPFLARRVTGGPAGNWAPLGDGVDGAVNALQTMGNDLVVAGAFRHAGGDSIPFVALWNDSANFTLAVDPPSRASDGVHLTRAGANPFRSLTGVQYTLDQPAVVELGVFDVRGALVRVLRSGFESSGLHNAQWDGTDLHGAAAPVGVYFIRLRAGRQSASMVVVRVR